MDAIRKQLDVLMGANRNGDVREVNRKYYDRDVCRLFLVGLCPHELFQLTVLFWNYPPCLDLLVSLALESVWFSRKCGKVGGKMKSRFLRTLRGLCLGDMEAQREEEILYLPLTCIEKIGENSIKRKPRIWFNFYFLFVHIFLMFGGDMNFLGEIFKLILLLVWISR